MLWIVASLLKAARARLSVDCSAFHPIARHVTAVANGNAIFADNRPVREPWRRQVQAQPGGGGLCGRVGGPLPCPGRPGRGWVSICCELPHLTSGVGGACCHVTVKAGQGLADVCFGFWKRSSPIRAMSFLSNRRANFELGFWKDIFVNGRICSSWWGQVKNSPVKSLCPSSHHHPPHAFKIHFMDVTSVSRWFQLLPQLSLEDAALATVELVT